ncbi:MAG: DedA family protein [Ilumatobacteraceae bacterium]
MINWAADVIDAIGLVGVAVLVALENVFPPIPSELILLLTGFNVSEGRFDFVSATISATIGSVVGAYFLYAIGRLVDEERLEKLLAGVGKYLGLKKSDVHKGFQWFERHGTAVVLFGRLIPVVRSVVSIPAGAEKMPMLRFTLLTAAGSIVWNLVWVAIGWGLGDQWEKAGTWGDYLQYGVIAAILVGLALIVVRARRRNQSASAPKD